MITRGWISFIQKSGALGLVFLKGIKEVVGFVTKWSGLQLIGSGLQAFGQYMWNGIRKLVGANAKKEFTDKQLEDYIKSSDG